MGEAKRRRERGEATAPGIKLRPRARAQGFRLAHHQRVEEQDDRGMVYARNIFRVVDDAGQTLVEETPDGPRPVLLMSVPQPIRRAVVAQAGLLVGRA